MTQMEVLFCTQPLCEKKLVFFEVVQGRQGVWGVPVLNLTSENVLLTAEKHNTMHVLGMFGYFLPTRLQSPKK